MKPIELNKYGLKELCENDFREINGGAKSALSKFFRGLTWGYLAKDVIDHWAEIKKGLKEGWDVEHHH